MWPANSPDLNLEDYRIRTRCRSMCSEHQSGMLSNSGSGWLRHYWILAERRGWDDLKVAPRNRLCVCALTLPDILYRWLRSHTDTVRCLKTTLWKCLPDELFNKNYWWTNCKQTVTVDYTGETTFYFLSFTTPITCLYCSNSLPILSQSPRLIRKLTGLTHSVC